MRQRLLVLIGLALALLVACVTIVGAGVGIWPGSMKLTAPVLCTDEQPDPFVVRTEYSDGDGTSYNFNLFCMGERGDYREVGVAKPAGLLFAWTYAILLSLSVTIWVLKRRRA